VIEGVDRDRLVELLDRPVLEVAPSLLGCRVHTAIDGEVTEIELTEVEAYAGAADPASHTYRGPTARNRSMFGGAGTLYVYRSYGIHWCANVVTGPPGSGEAVLLRGGVPTEGAEVMARRRGRAAPLAIGPGNLCQALAIDARHDGSSVIDGPVRLLPGTPPNGLLTTPRVGISVATEHQWRFVAATPRT
jgi:DNA-3-methyladenine glycosylase